MRFAAMPIICKAMGFAKCSTHPASERSPDERSDIRGLRICYDSRISLRSCGLLATCRDAFIDEPAHALAVDDIFVGEVIGGKGLRGMDIIKR